MNAAAATRGGTKPAFAVVLLVAAASLGWYGLRAFVVDAAASAPAPTHDRAAAAEEPLAAPPIDTSTAFPDGERELARPPIAPEASRAPQLRVRLRGLRDDVPWTGMVCYEWGAQKNHRAGPTTGVVAFELSNAPPNGVAKGWVTATDRRYIAGETRWIGTADREVTLDVHARARVTGVVRCPTAERVHCAVFALAMRDGHPTREVLDETNTAFCPEFSLLVPAGTAVFVAIVPTNEPIGFALDSFRGPDTLHGELLPTARVVTAPLGADTDLGVVDLPRAESLRGRITFTDGRPAQGILLTVDRETPRTIGRLTGFGEGTYSGVVWNDDGTLAPQTFGHTDRAGDFVLPAVPGREVVLTVDEQRTDSQYHHPEPELCIVGRSWSQRTTARRFDIRLRNPIRFVATVDGKPTDGNAWFEFDTATPAAPQARVSHYANRDGTLLVTGAFRAVRARAAGRVSPWRTIAADRSESEIALDANVPLGELAIDCSDDEVCVLQVRWRTADDHGEGRTYRRRGEAFRCFLPPGTNRLNVTGGSHDRTFLLPTEVDLDIGHGTTPQRWSLPIRAGGLLRLSVVDDDGRHLDGTVRVMHAGTVQDVVMRVRDHLGTTLDTAPPNRLSTFGVNETMNLLPAGDYRVTVSVAGHTFDEERVTVVARERVELHLRRP